MRRGADAATRVHTHLLYKSLQTARLLVFFLVLPIVSSCADLETLYVVFFVQVPLSLFLFAGMDFSLEIANKYIQELENLNNGIQREMNEVRKWSGNLFTRSIRLSRTVRQSWDRNVSLELEIRSLKENQCKHQSHLQAVSETRQALAKLRMEVLSTVNEFRSEYQEAQQLLNFFHNHLQATRASQKHANGPLPTCELFASQESTSSFYSDSSGTLEQPNASTCTWMFEKGDLLAWYTTSALALFEAS